MGLPSTLFCVLISASFVSGYIHLNDRKTRRPGKEDPEEGRKVTKMIRDRQPRSVTTRMKVLDFSADNDQEPDSNGEFTSASLDAGTLPESFTVCSAIMVDAWTTEFSAADMFALLGVRGYRYGKISLYAASSSPRTHPT